MYAAIYAILLPACSFAMGLFGFFVGRCGRKLPIIDNNLPWAMHRSQIPPSSTSADVRLPQSGRS